MAVPSHIDGAEVLQVAFLDGVKPTGATRHVVNGAEAGDFAALAIARYEQAQGVYLFYCDDAWQTVTDTYHETVDGAIEQARREYGPVQFRDVSDRR
jgi:hypothetical protein